DILGKHARNAAQRTNVVATDDVGMETQVDPGLAFASEVFLLLFRLEIFATRTLDGEVDVPSPVVDTIDQAHAATLVDLLHLVEVKNHIADFPFRRHLR